MLYTVECYSSENARVVCWVRVCNHDFNSCFHELTWAVPVLVRISLDFNTCSGTVFRPNYDAFNYSLFVLSKVKSIKIHDFSKRLCVLRYIRLVRT